MMIEEINSGYEKTVVEEARKCALATIHAIYEKHKECDSLSDVDIDKVRDCLQCLAYFKTVDKTVDK